MDSLSGHRHTVTSSLQNNWSDPTGSANPFWADEVNDVSWEEMVSSELPVTTFSELYIEDLHIEDPQLLQGAQTQGKESPQDSAAARPTDLAMQKFQVIPGDKEPEHLNANHSEDGRKKTEEGEAEESLAECCTGWRLHFAHRSLEYRPRKGLARRAASGITPKHQADAIQICQGTRRKITAVQQEDGKEGKKREEEAPQKKFVSKPLMDTLWTKFKTHQFLTIRESFALAFEFSLSENQINQWFCQKRKKYNTEIRKWKSKKRFIKRKIKKKLFST